MSIRLWRDPGLLLCLGLLLLYAVITLLALTGVWTGPAQAPGALSYAAPGGEHWLGTNRNGQDVAARAALATARACTLGLAVALASTLLGALLGGAAAQLGRSTDEAVLWVAGVLDALPFYLFVFALAFALQQHPLALPLAMSLSLWTSTARLVRAEILQRRNESFVDAAQLAGLSERQILLRHLLPHSAPLLIVQFIAAFAAAIKAEVALSFLGLGSALSWGGMLAQAAAEVSAGHFQNLLAATLAFSLLLLMLNLLGERLQLALDPRSR